jgi:hypothetical protein
VCRVSGLDGQVTDTGFAPTTEAGDRLARARPGDQVQRHAHSTAAVTNVSGRVTHILRLIGSIYLRAAVAITQENLTTHHGHVVKTYAL